MYSIGFMPLAGWTMTSFKNNPTGQKNLTYSKGNVWYNFACIHLCIVSQDGKNDFLLWVMLKKLEAIVLYDNLLSSKLKSVPWKEKAFAIF